MASHTVRAAIRDRNMAERFLMHLRGTGQATHKATADVALH